MSLNMNFKNLYYFSLKKTYEWRQTRVGGRKMTAPFHFGWDKLYKGILAFKSGAFAPSNTIFITGTPRSGTTWLSELISSSRDYVVIFEPTGMWMKYGVVQSDKWMEYINPDSQWSEGKELFSKLFEGRSVHPHAFVHNSPIKLLRTKSLVIKDIDSNMLLPRLANNFNIRGMILIIRHPCEVVASTKKHLANTPKRVTAITQRYVKENLPHLTSFIQILQKTRIEIKQNLLWDFINYINNDVQKMSYFFKMELF